LASQPTKVIAGIDTHADTHHVAVINEHGKPLADKEFLAVGSGYRKIIDFITSWGTVTAVGEARICSTNAAQGVLLPGQCNPGSPRVGGDKTLLRVVEPPPAVDMTSGTWRGTSRALD